MRFRAPSGARRAFTLVEVVVALAILLIVAAAATPLAADFFAATQLDEETARVIVAFRTARERAIAGYHDARHGVYIDTTPEGRARYTLYEGSSWASRVSAEDVVVVLDDPFAFSGASDVNFTKGSGTTTPVALTLAHEAEGSRSVSITSFGIE